MRCVGGGGIFPEIDSTHIPGPDVNTIFKYLSGRSPLSPVGNNLVKILLELGSGFEHSGLAKGCGQVVE